MAVAPLRSPLRLQAPGVANTRQKGDVSSSAFVPAGPESVWAVLADTPRGERLLRPAPSEEGHQLTVVDVDAEARGFQAAVEEALRAHDLNGATSLEDAATELTRLRELIAEAEVRAEAQRREQQRLRIALASCDSQLARSHQAHLEAIAAVQEAEHATERERQSHRATAQQLAMARDEAHLAVAAMRRSRDELDVMEAEVQRLRAENEALKSSNRPCDAHLAHEDSSTPVSVAVHRQPAAARKPMGQALRGRRLEEEDEEADVPDEKPRAERVATEAETTAGSVRRFPSSFPAVQPALPQSSPFPASVPSTLEEPGAVVLAPAAAEAAMASIGWSGHRGRDVRLTGGPSEPEENLSALFGKAATRLAHSRQEPESQAGDADEVAASASDTSSAPAGVQASTTNHSETSEPPSTVAALGVAASPEAGKRPARAAKRAPLSEQSVGSSLSTASSSCQQPAVASGAEAVQAETDDAGDSADPGDADGAPRIEVSQLPDLLRAMEGSEADDNADDNGANLVTESVSCSSGRSCEPPLTVPEGLSPRLLSSHLGGLASGGTVCAPFLPERTWPPPSPQSHHHQLWERRGVGRAVANPLSFSTPSTPGGRGSVFAAARALPRGPRAGPTTEPVVLRGRSPAQRGPPTFLSARSNLASSAFMLDDNLLMTGAAHAETAR